MNEHNEITEEDRLEAALKGNKMAAENKKMWYLIEKTRRSGHRITEKNKMNDLLRNRLLNKGSE